MTYASSTAGVTINLYGEVGIGGDAAGDQIIFDVEKLTGSNFDDVLGGGVLDSTIEGLGGRDYIAGGIGKNEIYGGAADDVLAGFGGADKLDGGAGIDTADYSASAQGVAIDLRIGTASGGDAQGDTLTGIEKLIGSAFADNFTGGAERGDFRGGDDNDTLTGGSVFDWMEGGAGNDTITGTGGQTAQFGGEGDDTLTGSLENGNSIYGGADNDVMTGGNFTDTLSDTEGGDDQMFGGGGNDMLVDTVGVNSLYGQGGDDTLVSAGSASYLDGGTENDSLTAGIGDSTLVGGAGNDTIDAYGSGDHVFTGGADADTFVFRIGSGLTTTVTDFEDGLDKILLWDSGQVSFESLTIADGADGAVISWNGTNDMGLTAIAASQITQDDFIV